MMSFRSTAICVTVVWGLATWPHLLAAHEIVAGVLRIQHPWVRAVSRDAVWTTGYIIGIVNDGSEPGTPDIFLVRLLVRANAIRDQLLADRSLTFEDIAKSEGVVPSYATRLFRLTILAPDIVSAILSGKHPPELTARRLMDDTRLPLDWNEQRRCLGFASAHWPTALST